VKEDFAGAAERRRHNQAAAAVIQRGDAEGRQDDGRGGFLFDTPEREGPGWGGAKDAADVDERAGLSCIHLR
jgi:hypothetical protein